MTTIRVDEKGDLARTLSILPCVAGVALVVGVGDSFWIGLIVVGLAPLVYAVNTVLSKDLVAQESPLVVSAANLLLVTVGLLPFLGAGIPAKLGGMHRVDWAALAFCVLPGTVLGYAAWYAALRVLSPSTLSLPVFGCR